MRYGAITSVILIILSLIMHLTGLYDPASAQNSTGNLMNCLNYIIMIAGMVMAIKYHRDNELGGFLKLGRGIGVGTLTGLVIGMTSAIWIVLYMKLIAPDSVQKTMDAVIQNAQPGQEEMAEKMAAMFSNPFTIAALSLVGSLIIGLLTGLIGGAILKKEPSSLNDNSKQTSS